MRLVTLCVASFVATSAAWADSGQIIANSNLEDLCKAPSATYRKTLVYVDMGSLSKDETEWGLAILNKLELAPRETLVVMGVNPSTFEVSEYFDSCYPTLTKKELEAEAKSRTTWARLTQMGPEAQQRENLQAFDTHLRASLNKLMEASVKLPQPKRRDVLGALALDKDRFTDGRALYRIILFTKGAITEPSLAPTATDEQVIQFLTEKYATTFSGADVFVYGVAGEAERSLEARAKIFSAFFLTNWSLMRSFSPSLPQQKSQVYGPGETLNGTFEGGGVKGNVKLMFTPGEGAQTAKAWLAFLVGTKSLYVPVQGDYSCNDDKCTLRGTVAENVPSWSASPYFRKGDRLELDGKRHGNLEGALQPATREVFSQEANKNVQYALTFHGE